MRVLKLGRDRARTWWLLGGLLVTACLSAKESPQAGGESHFLKRCDNTCGAGLDCIQGVCTRGCVVDKQSCSDLATGAVCTAESVEPGEVAVCDVGCKESSECAGVSASHRCEAGFCRAPIALSGGPSAGGGYPTDKVFPCPENVASAEVEVLHALILGSELQLRINFGGVCHTDTLAVCFGPEFNEPQTIQTTLRVVHESQGDPCLSHGTKELSIDLTPLAQHYERSYRSKAGLVQTNFGLYAFGELSCEDRTRAGEAQVKRFEEQASRPCTSVDDCQEASFNTRCTRGCGTVIAKASAADFSSWLSVMDEEVCGDYLGAGCLPLPIYDCGELSPMCVQGRCKHQY